jgi:hypothetical protein
MQTSILIILLAIAIMLRYAHRLERDIKMKDGAIVREVCRSQELIDYGVNQGHNRNMLSKLAAIFLLALTTLPATAQNQPAGMRMEVAESETDHGEYSIFTYVDEDGTFGYYLGLGRLANFLEADEILGMEIKNVKETTVCLGATYDEAFAALDNIMALYDKDLDTTVELQGRTVTGSGQLGLPTNIQCVVVKKMLGGKRLQFVFPFGKHSAHAFLTKQVLKELRTEMKIDKKLHPKHHR